MTNTNKTCFDNSLQASEQIFATAPNVNFWILIEYKDFWEEKAFNNCDIDIEVKLEKVSKDKKISVISLKNKMSFEKFSEVIKKQRKDKKAIEDPMGGMDMGM